jgi:peptidyl-prolyl cis-trans isomerase B (cyclophilin B)
MTMSTAILLASLFSFGAAAPQDAKETAAWTALNAVVPAQKYPQRQRFQKLPEPRYAEQLAQLDKVLETAAGTSVEPVVLYYRGNALFQLERFADAKTCFEDLKARFPQHGLCKVSAGPEHAGPSLADLALRDATSEVDVRKRYTVKNLPEAVLDQSAKAVFHTTKGDITIKFYSSAAPETVANFKKLVQNGQYVDTYFHRVIPMQRVVGGCPNTKKDNRPREDDGMGSLGYDLPYEVNTAMHKAGAISMLRIAGTERVHSCQFSICIIDQPELNTQQAVFGEVVDGLDVVKKTSQERADDLGNPYEHVTITGTEWVAGGD